MKCYALNTTPFRLAWRHDYWNNHQSNVQKYHIFSTTAFTINFTTYNIQHSTSWREETGEPRAWQWEVTVNHYTTRDTQFISVIMYFITTWSTSFIHLSFLLFQDQVDKEHLIKALHEELVTLVNDVGVDPNRILNHQHTVALLQFVCGLGPRKASSLIKVILS